MQLLLMSLLNVQLNQPNGLVNQGMGISPCTDEQGTSKGLNLNIIVTTFQTKLELILCIPLQASPE